MIDFYKSTLTEEMRNMINLYAAAFDLIPGVVIIHDPRDWSVVYMSERGLKQLKLSLKEVCSLSSTEYYSRYFNAEDAADYVPKIGAFMYQNNGDDTLSFYQQLKFPDKNDWSWHLSSIKIFMRDEAGKPLLTVTVSIPIDAMHHMAAKAERLLEENNFLRNNLDSFSKLSKREKIVLGEMALGQSSTEIANKLCISSTTVDTHRRNIRVKLKVKSFFEISKYARAFDLI